MDQFTPHNRDAPHFYVIHSQLNAVLKTIKNKDCMAAPAELRLLNQNQRILWAHLCPYSNRYSCAHRAQNFGAQDGHKHAARNKKFLDRENWFPTETPKWRAFGGKRKWRGWRGSNFGGQSQLSLLKSFNLPQNGVNRCSPALNKFAYNLIVI